ncbi:hypothetical protein KY284_021948 [Solanum tuberosum]|nr:hypothetical protein KY284_021948 [Solanum tuberosum]
MDKPWWIKSSTGKFTVKSAWEILRSRDEVSEDIKRIWGEGATFQNFLSLVGGYGLTEFPLLPLLISFLHGILTFLPYVSVAGSCPWVQIKYTMKKWWVAQGNTRLRMVFQAVPNIILWFLWKRRNTILHGGVYIRNKVIWDINATIHKFIRSHFHYDHIPNTWPYMVALLERFRPVVHSKIVKWIPPPIGWLKCNIDGASRGNPVAEAKAISEGLQYCLENHYSNIIIETDSLAMVNIINGDWKIPWSVSIEVGSIHRIRDLISVHMNLIQIKMFLVKAGRLS